MPARRDARGQPALSAKSAVVDLRMVLRPGVRWVSEHLQSLPGHSLDSLNIAAPAEVQKSQTARRQRLARGLRADRSRGHRTRIKGTHHYQSCRASRWHRKDGWEILGQKTELAALEIDAEHPVTYLLGGGLELRSRSHIRTSCPNVGQT